jgi:hypothetical protein
MKKKIMTLVLAGALTLGGITVAYATTRSNTTLNNFNRSMMGTQNGGSMMGSGNVNLQSNDKYNDMIKLMKTNGFSEQARAMENRDFEAMNEFMANISDADYEKMVGIMQENGYGPMANMMKSLGKEGMINMHQGMMER